MHEVQEGKNDQLCYISIRKRDISSLSSYQPVRLILTPEKWQEYERLWLGMRMWNVKMTLNGIIIGIRSCQNEFHVLVNMKKQIQCLENKWVENEAHRFLIIGWWIARMKPCIFLIDMFKLRTGCIWERDSGQEQLF